jgi:peptidoglycan/xylan/chitin deacetylase (PgdA/CDA1 family)
MMAFREYSTNWKDAVPLPQRPDSKIRAWVRKIFLSTLAPFSPTPSDKFLRVLFCHYVFDNQKEQFERILIHLKEIGTFINTDTFLDILEGRLEIDRRYFLLTFDDGFRNIFKNAFPILNKHNISSLFFVPSAFIEADWNTTHKFCTEITSYRNAIEMVQWRELQEMASYGHEIGSHTKTHSRFSDISRDINHMEDEINGSKHQIEDNIGKECRFISWPYGTKKDADDPSRDAAQKAGYKGCFGAFRGSISQIPINRFNIPRHHFEVQWPLSHIKYFARGNMELE